MQQERDDNTTLQNEAADATQDDDHAARKSSRMILIEELSHGIAEYERPTLGLLLSSLAAGLAIGFSVLLMAVTLTLTTGQLSKPLIELLLANMYAFGFILVILGRSALFTEHTTLAVLPVLARRYAVIDLARVWTIVFLGNILGCVLFTGLLVWIAPARGTVEVDAFVHIAGELTDVAWWVILLSAVLAGWLMGEMGWLVAASRDTVSQFIGVWLIAAAIGFAKLHHSIVGTVEVLAGVLVSDAITWGDFGSFLFWTTLGNAIGGVVFVALLKYGHASRATDKQATPSISEEVNAGSGERTEA